MGISDEGVRLTLRLPEELRQRLGQSAIANHRSLNSEIVAQLEDASDRNQISEKSVSYNDMGLEARINKLDPAELRAVTAIIDLLIRGRRKHRQARRSE